MTHSFSTFKKAGAVINRKHLCFVCGIECVPKRYGVQRGPLLRPLCSHACAEVWSARDWSEQ